MSKMHKYLNSKGTVEFFREFVSIVNRYKAPPPVWLYVYGYSYSS
jgi:hypothetical protein